MPIDQSAQFIPLYLLIAIIAGRSPFLLEYPWCLLKNACPTATGRRVLPSV